MRIKLIFVCTLVALSLGLVACTSEQASLEVSCDEFMKSQHFSREANANAGDSVVVTLCSNPSTGFQWSETAQISDETVLRQINHEFVSPEKDVPGAAGREVWTFEALRAGTSTISMEYSRPWEGGEKGEWTFIATVTVE